MLLCLFICPGLRAAAPPPIPPTILKQPQDQTTEVGGEAMFSITVGPSYTPLRYQWLFNGVNLSRATNALLTVTNVQPADAGSYMVIVRNSTGPISSSPALLTVLSLIPPSITTPPQSQMVTAGATVTFNVMATGSGQLSYQWQFNGVDLSGATDASLTLNNVQTAHAGSYTVIVSNAGGKTISSAATLAVSSLVRFELVALPAGNSPLFQLRVTASAGQSVVLEASIDLKTWLPVLTNSAANGTFDFSDSDSAKFNQRFYRGLTQ